ncbi:hypothetical protein [Amnibacterium kyonggiense]
MTDDTSTREPYDPDNDPDGYPADAMVPNDWMLETFVRHFTGPDDKSESTIDLTVVVGGVLVTGVLISGDEHTRLMEERMEQAAPGFLDGYRTIAHAADEARREQYERRTAADLPLPARRFLHLKDVTIFGGSTTANVPLWRGLMDSVTGWTFGKLS